MEETALFKIGYGGSYVRSIQTLLEHVEKYESVLNPYIIPFLITCAAAIEALLNDAIIVECRHRFPRKDIKRISSAHLGMSLSGKLDNLGWLLTDNEFITNNESAIYQQLKFIIKKRNEIMHRKEFHKEVKVADIETTESGEEKVWFTLDEGYFDSVRNSPENVSYEECVAFCGAVTQLEETIVNITSHPPIEKNDLFVRNKA